MSADFKPALDPYKSLRPFQFWAQTTLPTVFDDSLSYYEVLTKLVGMVNTMLENTDTAEANIEAIAEVFSQLQDYVNHYFDDLDVTEEVNAKLDEMAEDGTLSEIIMPLIARYLDETVPEIVDARLSVVVHDQLPDVVSQQIDDAVDPLIQPAVDTFLDAELGDYVEEALPPVVTAQLPAEVALQFPAVAAEQLPAMVDAYLDDNLGEVVEDQLPPVVDSQLEAIVHEELPEVVQPFVNAEVSSTTANWLATHISNPSNPPLDSSLSVKNAAAESWYVGKRIYDLQSSPPTMTEDVKIDPVTGAAATVAGWLTFKSVISSKFPCSIGYFSGSADPSDPWTYAFYDSEDTFISGGTWTQFINWGQVTIPIPQNTAYIQFSMQYTAATFDSDNLYVLVWRNGKQLIDALNDITVEVTVDPTLSVAGEAADAKATGDAINGLRNTLDTVAAMESEPLSYQIGGSGFVKIADGGIASGSTFSYTDYVDVGSFGVISYKRHKSTSTNPTGGMAFYNASKVFVSSVPAVAGQSSAGYADDLYSVPVPDSAKFARFTTYADTETYGEFAVYGERKIVSTINENASDIADVREIVTEAGVVATGIAARIESAFAGPATCETAATTVLRYRQNLRTRVSAPSNSKLSTDENGAWVLNGTIGSSAYYIDLQTGIKLTAGVTYRVDGSPRTSDNAGLCLYVNGTRYAYDNNKNGATYTPSTNVSADLKLRVMANETYNNVKFYPVVCENAAAARFAPDALELLEGKNEVVGLDFSPLTVTYEQDKLQILDNKIDTVVARDFTLDDITPYEDEDGYVSSSFAVMMRQPFWTNGRIVGIVSQHVEGDTKASLTIQLCDSSGAAFYVSRKYAIGGTVEATMQEFKCPPSAKTNVLSYDHVRVSVTVPEGTKLKISNFYSFEAWQARHNDDCGIKWHAHAGFSGLCPKNTIPSFQYAGKLGFSSCITIPKFTSDGVGVCFHDDGSISDDLVWMDGSAITGDDNIGIANYTYDYITENFRIKTTWDTLHVPTLEDFFRICSMCNMAPILSVHSTGFGSTYEAGFAYIRQLAVKWNVLNKLWIKSGSASVQSAAFEVFGTDMAGMILIRGQSSTWDPLAQAKLIVNNNGDHVLTTTATSAKEAVLPLVFELFQTAASDEAIALGISEGFAVSVCTVDAGLTGPVMQTFISKGVTEFTDDYHCSLGLDWTCV